MRNMKRIILLATLIPSDKDYAFNASLNSRLFLDRYGIIQHPIKGAIPFHLWDWQRDVLHAFQYEKQVIILKARQLGVSELAMGHALWLARFHPSKMILCLSRNEADAQTLIQRAQFMHANLPPFLQAGSQSVDKCLLGKSNAGQLQFIHQIDGRAQPSTIISLAATKGAGRGYPASLVILDEWAFQQWDDDIWAAIMPTISTGGSLIGISTANGLGNVFHRQWTNAIAHTNTFYPIFLPWHIHRERDATWYEQQRRNMEPWQLHQEYPSVPNDAFVQTGRPVFDSSYLSCDNLPIIEQYDGVTIWEEPQEDHQYIITADVAEGLPNGDYDSALVLDQDTYAVCAELHGQWPPEIFTEKIIELGIRYNYALLAPERNNHGHAVLLALRDRGYINIYNHQDAFTGTDDVRPGFPTNKQTKTVAVSSLAQLLREGSWHERSQAGIAELQTFRYTMNGSMSAPPGYHDDRVTTRWIAAWILMHPTTSRTIPIPVHFHAGKPH